MSISSVTCLGSGPTPKTLRWMLSKGRSARSAAALSSSIEARMSPRRAIGSQPSQ